jgi:hypothetical protein
MMKITPRTCALNTMASSNQIDACCEEGKRDHNAIVEAERIEPHLALIKSGDAI